VRTKLVSQAKDWKWSGANAHLTGSDAAVIRVKPMLELFPDWASYFAKRGQDGAERTRLHTRTGGRLTLRSPGRLIGAFACYGKLARIQAPLYSTNSWTQG
jgi:hypothetical protein